MRRNSKIVVKSNVTVMRSEGGLTRTSYILTFNGGPLTAIPVCGSVGGKSVNKHVKG